MGELTQIVTIGADFISRISIPAAQEAFLRVARLSPEERQAEDAVSDARNRAEMRAMYRLTMIENSGLEGAMLDRRLSNLQGDSPSQREAVNVAKAFVEAFPHVDGRGLALWGEPGRRKSSIMAALVHAILAEKKRQYNCRFIPCQEIDEVLKERDIWLDIERADLVVFDDLEKAMDPPDSKYHTANDRIIRGVINHADRSKRPVICITSNKSPEQHRMLGTHWASRVVGLCHWVEVVGERDLREYEKKNGWWSGNEASQ